MASPDPADPAPSSAPTARRWPWWKRILAALAVLVLLLVVFYRPILFGVAKIAAKKVGASQGLDIQFTPSGSIFGGLTLKDVHVTPTRPGPIEKADVGELKLNYSLPGLVRGGLGGKWLEDVEVRDVHFVYDPNKAPPSPPKKKEPFKLPPLPFPDRLVLQNINVQLRPTDSKKAEAAGQAAASSSAVPIPIAPAVAQAATAVNESGLLVSNLNLELLPDRPGRLKLDELRVPGGPDFKNVTANTTYKDRDIEFTDLVLADNFKLRRLGIDASKLDQQILALRLDGDVFAGRATADVQLQGIGVPPRAHVQLDLADISLASLRDFLKLETALDGRVDALHLTFDGQSDKPRTWNGQFEAHARDVASPPTKLDRVDILLPIANGNARLDQFQVTQAANGVSAKANMALPENIADLPQASVRGDLNLKAPDLASLPVALPPELGLRGAFEAAGPFALEGGELDATLSGRARDVSAANPDAAVTGAEFTAEVHKTLPRGATAPPTSQNAPPPPPKPWFDALQTKLHSTLTNVRYGPYLLDTLTLGVTTDGPDAKVETVEAVRGPNKVALSARYAIPAPGVDPLKQPLTADLAVDAPDLSRLSADLKAEPLAGRFAAKGHVETVNGALKGGLELGGRDIAARGLKIQTVDGNVGVENNVITANALKVRLDDRSGLDVSGTFGLDAPKPFTGKLDVNLPDLAVLAPALAANGVNKPLAGSLRVTGDATGRLGNTPDDRQINADLNVAARDLNAVGVRIAGADAKVVVANNEAVIRNGQIRFDEKNVIGIGGRVGLAGTQPFDLNTVVDFPNLAAFEPTLRGFNVNEPIAGSARIEFRATGDLAAAPATPGAKPAPAVRDGAAVLTARDVRVRNVRAVQSLDGRVNLANNRAVVQAFVLKFDDKNTVTLDADAGLGAPFDYRGTVAGDLNDLKSFEPLLKAFSPPPKSPVAGDLRAPGGAPRLESAARQRPRSQAPSARSWDEGAERLPAPGGRRPPSPRVVSGISAGGKNGESRRLLAGTSGVPARNPPPRDVHLAGSVKLRWQGEGSFPPPPPSPANADPASGIPHPASSPPEGTGSASVTARGVEFNATGPVDADVAGKYTLPEPVELPTFTVRLNGAELRATLDYRNGLVKLDNLRLAQRGTDLIVGYAHVPLRPGDPAGIIPDVDAIDVNVDSKVLDLPTLFALVNAKDPAPVLGTLQLGVHARGSLSKLAADVRVAGRQLRPTKSVGLEPATLDVALNLKDDRLNLVASLLQPQFKALEIKGNVPLPLNAVLKAGAIDPKSPVDLRVTLPDSDLGFLTRLVPKLAYINGRANADVRVAGTIENPTFAGALEANVAGARADNITFPRIADLGLRVTFTQRQVVIERCGGDIGGGQFRLGGRVDFARLTPADARIDLTLTARDVLAYRDDNTTARVNADVRVNGPFPAATVSGRVGVTKSRFLKDIDIVPINLPGRPAPAPPAAAESAGPQTVSIDAPPVRDWKFDLRIATDDPFLVRGNLANGQALVDLTLKGTGAKPILAGFVTVENLVATLPFSRLEIQNGNIQFTPDQPLNPVLDLRGVSTIRDRVVTVYITGRAREPKTQFTSEPPLPQEQIVSLLATGATTEELTGNTEALAGKATILLLQDIYRRNFKPKGRTNPNPEPTLADKIDLDVGNVDARTGRQQVSGRYKVTDRVQVIADLGIEGDLRGRVKYLVRFR